MIARGTLALALLLPGCGGEANAPDAAEIERLSTPPNLATVAPQPDPIGLLQPSDLAALAGRPSCAFTRGGTVLLAFQGGEAVARISGVVRRLQANAAVGPTGGFFTDGQASISIGRSDDGGRLTVTDRGTDQQQDIRGEWACRQAG